ncbi:MAG: hypothetical protein ACYTFG_10830 [Planctomycetota bacterium]|jgi:hypothetical protein
MSESESREPLVERLKTLRPPRKVRRFIVQVVCVLMTMFLLAEAAGAVLMLAGVFKVS